MCGCQMEKKKKTTPTNQTNEEQKTNMMMTTAAAQSATMLSTCMRIAIDALQTEPSTMFFLCEFHRYILVVCCCCQMYWCACR